MPRDKKQPSNAKQKIVYLKLYSCIGNHRWLIDVQSKPKLRTYVCFKDDNNAESYVHTFLTRRQRSLLAQLRLGILPLHIETGRFRNIKDSTTGQLRKMHVNERKCNICKSDEVEDEIHFICVCNTYENERQALYSVVGNNNLFFMNMDVKEKFIYLLKNECNILAKFLEKIWAKRESLLFV